MSIEFDKESNWNILKSGGDIFELIDGVLKNEEKGEWRIDPERDVYVVWMRFYRFNLCV